MTQRTPRGVAASLAGLLARGDELLVGLLVGGMCVMALLAIVMRQLGAPLLWPEELNRQLLMWLCFAGAVSTTRRGVHIMATTALLERLPAPARLAAGLVGQLLTIWLAIVLVVEGIHVAQALWPMKFISLPWLNYGFMAAIMPLAAALMALYIARDIVVQLRKGIDR